MKKKMKYRPQKKFSVAEDGFFGEFYQTENDRFPGKCMIAFGGSQGLFLLCQWMAEKFIDAGMNVLIIAYHKEKGLPKDLRDQPVESVENAALWLRSQGFKKIGVWGISMGGTLALLVGSMFPDLISCVVSIAPMEMVPQAQNSKGPIAGSAFAYRGKPLPYMSYVPDDHAWTSLYLKTSWQHKEPYSKDLLRIAYHANSNPEAIIPIWKINGPILLLGSVNDSVCPDEETINRLIGQLAEHRFKHVVETHIYKHISHLLVPVKPYSLKLFKAERKDPAGCAADRAASWRDTLMFLKNKW